MGENLDPKAVRFGENLRRLRRLGGLSQERLGGRIGVTFQQIQKYENGRNAVSVPTLCRLCVALGCTAADLLAGLEGEGRPASEPATVRQQRLVARLSRAVLAIESAALQDKVVELVEVFAGRRPGE
jgi:transcriptional regulator with XRE-family HTH domain